VRRRWDHITCKGKTSGGAFKLRSPNSSVWWCWFDQKRIPSRDYDEFFSHSLLSPVEVFEGRKGRAELAPRRLQGRIRDEARRAPRAVGRLALPLIVIDPPGRGLPGHNATFFFDAFL